MIFTYNVNVKTIKKAILSPDEPFMLIMWTRGVDTSHVQYNIQSVRYTSIVRASHIITVLIDRYCVTVIDRHNILLL